MSEIEESAGIESEVEFEPPHRAERGVFYYVVSSNVLEHEPIYRALEKNDSFDERIWREGRYFNTLEQAERYVKEERQRIKKERIRSLSFYYVKRRIKAPVAARLARYIITEEQNEKSQILYGRRGRKPKK